MARQRPRPARRVSPHRAFLLVAGGAAACIAVGAHWVAGWGWTWAYLAAINLVTIGLYGIDKRRSTAGGTRVPETVLHLAAGIGGTPGAFTGQQLFRHKTAKVPFQLRFWTIAAVQVLVLSGWWYLLKNG